VEQISDAVAVTTNWKDHNCIPS